MNKHSVEENVLSRPEPLESIHIRAVRDGLRALSDLELMAAVIAPGGRDKPAIAFAASLLSSVNGVGALARLGLGELIERPGMGPARATRLACAIELGRRAIVAAALDAGLSFPDCDAVARWARPTLGTLDHEELWVLALDGQNGLRAARRVASGGIHGLHVGVRDVLRTVLKEAASAFVLVHNHPSGDPTPSEEDVVFTRAVREGADAVGTPLLDHVIVARQRTCSILELGLVSFLRA